MSLTHSAALPALPAPPAACGAGEAWRSSAGAEREWFAVYTAPNHERRVAGQFEQGALDHFLPLYESVRQRKDRRVRLQLPLFPGYVFARIARFERIRVLETPGVVRLVGFGGRPAPLPAAAIETLRRGLAGHRAEPHPFLTAGRRVRIRCGALQGLEGVLTRVKSAPRVVISVELIQRSVAVELDPAELEPLF